jgi:hypothetical protein
VNVTNPMSNRVLRRLIASYSHCRRYAPFFEVHVIEVGRYVDYFEVDDAARREVKQRFTWFATAKLRNGRLFCRALNVDLDQTNRWRIRDGVIGVMGPSSGPRKYVPDITAAFADWLEHVEDALGNVAFRGLIDNMSGGLE